MKNEPEKLLKQQQTILTEAPLVLMNRIQMFSQPVWTWHTMLEFQRMYLEKVAAMSELWYKWMQFYLSPANTRMWAQLPDPKSYYKWIDDSTRAANRALYPVSSRVHVNKRRLSRKK